MLFYSVGDTPDDKKPVTSPDDEESRDSAMETDQAEGDQRDISVEDADTILTCLEEINKVLRNADNTIVRHSSVSVFCIPYTFVRMCTGTLPLGIVIRVLVLILLLYLQAQPRRTMPNQVKYSVELKPYDAFPNLLHMFNSW